ncbi:4'-phosphopantetheinyl transferase family protein [Hymenobacter arizonensis]|uniref:4'-phosphopantetheinyl transferase superfamily protein n=1 Tax=Hymenobacter arizonensis TaxID=1227077 RepID=A0A1I6AZU6_HYMAR|nr:4'-phosphopantetheinyl transferase superfamily protein [Hymenobacter arizonensis]SFQ74190.1 4'-phosphopantetheinyl transferase superfamily protein [Hymenobacter arizonensis]
MPLHSLQHLSPTAVLGLWQLTETPAELWAQLPQAAAYQALMPATADASRQAQWLAGRALAHTLLQELTAATAADMVVHNDATGRPWLAGPTHNLTLSLSHSGEWVAAVLAAGGRAGVDVEIIRDKAQRLASKFLSTLEWDDAAAAALTAPEAANTHYTRLWSAKETLYKLAAQRGIIFKKQLLLSSFVPEESGEIPATLVLDCAETRHCICYCQPAPGYVLTYCHESFS